jgi:virulence factor Mce-like protein
MSPIFHRGDHRSGGKRQLSPIASGVIAALLLLVVSWAVFRKDNPFTHGQRLDMVFRNSNQLIKGSPVRIAGIDVGKVVQIKFGPGRTTEVVRVELKKEGLPIHADAVARIRPRLFLEGGFYIELHPGSASGPELKDKGMIPLGQTSQPVQFNQILSELQTPTRKRLRGLLKELDTTLDGGGAEGFGRAIKPLAPALKDTAQISEALRGTEAHDLSAVISTSARATKALASSKEQLAQLVTAVNVTMGALSSNDAALAASVRELDGTLQVAPAALTALDNALPSLNRTARDLRPALPLAPQVLSDSAKLLVQLRLASRPQEIPRLLANLKPALRTLPQLESRLVTLLGLVTPVTDCLRDNALPVLNATVPDGSLTAPYPVYLELAHGFTGLASSAGNFDGNGPWAQLSFDIGAPNGQIVTVPGIPEFGTLVGATANPILGSNPQYLGRGVEPPKRPDQECRKQAPVDLKQRNTIFSAAARAATRTISRPRTDKVPSVAQYQKLLSALGTSVTALRGASGR